MWDFVQNAIPWLVLAAVVVLVVWLKRTSFGKGLLWDTVPEQHVGFVTLFDKVVRQEEKGFVWLCWLGFVPGLYKLQKRVYLGKQELKLPVRVVFADNVVATLHLQLPYRVDSADARKFAYEVKDPVDYANTIVPAPTVATAKRFTQSEAYADLGAIVRDVGDLISDRMRNEVGITLLGGARIEKVELPAEYEKALTGMKQAELERTARETKALADKNVKLAEAEAEAGYQRAVIESLKAGLKNFAKDTGCKPTDVIEFVRSVLTTDQLAGLAGGPGGRLVVMGGGNGGSGSDFARLLAAFEESKASHGAPPASR